MKAAERDFHEINVVKRSFHSSPSMVLEKVVKQSNVLYFRLHRFQIQLRNLYLHIAKPNNIYFEEI
jgi:hypothetical protein